MKSYHIFEEFLLNIIILSIVFGLAIPKSDDKSHKNRIIDPLSDEEHYTGPEHNEHNPEYDHKAFLGEDADDFDQLSPEESKRRLALMVDKIDKNSDGFITTQELKDWIHISQKKYIIDDVDRQWNTQTSEDPSITQISWDEYKKKTFGFLDQMTESASEEMNTYKEMLKYYHFLIIYLLSQTII